jgi:cytochrome bd-type quinol oxidase subunit 2
MQVLQGSPRSSLTRLPIASFTVVMAAAVLSVAASDASQVDLAAALRWLAIVMFGVLASLRAARMLLHSRVNAKETGHPETAFDAFSLVAAISVSAVALAPQLAGWLLASYGEARLSSG